MSNIDSVAQYHVVPQTNPPVRFSGTAQAAESQPTPPCSQRFNLRTVALIGAIAVGTAVIGVTIWALSPSNNEATEEPESLAGQNITIVMNTAKMMTEAVTQIAHSATEVVTQTVQSVTEAATQALQSLTETSTDRPITSCYKNCPRILNPVCTSNGHSYDNLCIFENKKCSGEIAQDVSIVFASHCALGGTGG